MRSFTICLIAITLVNISLLNFTFANENDGTITGTVRSGATKNIIPGITVAIPGTSIGTYTGTDGKFTINNSPIGVISVRFSGVGYETFVQTNVVVTHQKPTILDIELIEKTIELKGAEVISTYFVKRVDVLTSTQFLNSEDIRRAPGVQEDVIRATALLPGVGVTQAGRNDLLVRGGAPFENLFVVDNIEVPNINHFGSQGSSGGPLSLINIDFVKNVSFSAGAFGSRYGDKVSSITNITLRNGNQERFTTKAVLSATGFGVNLEGPINQNSNYMFSARRSYLDWIFKAAGFAFIPQYWDFQGKIFYRLDEKNTLSFLTIAALDDVILNNENDDNIYKNSQVAIPNQKQYFSGLTWQHLLGNGFLTATFGHNLTKFSTYQNDSLDVQIFKNFSKENEIVFKTDVDFMISPHLEFMLGNQIKWSPDLDYDVYIPGYLRLDNNNIPTELKTDTTLSVFKNSTYGSLTTSFGSNKITLGARLDYYDFLQNKFYFSPRASYIHQFNPVSALILSLGRYYQSPSYVWLIGAPNQNLKPIQSDQIVLGYEHTLREDLKIQVETYYKWYDNYPARVFRPQAVLSPSGFDDLTSDIPFGLEPLTSIGTGVSRGVEIFVQKKLSELPLYGLLSISISETKFKSIEGKERAGSFDARFISNLVIGYRFNQEWELSGKFRYSTGIPTTPFITEGEKIGQRDYSQYNEGERLPDFHALDIRLDKRWNFSSFDLVTYIDIQNIYGRKNVNGIRWDSRTQDIKIQDSIGLLPSIGISFEI